MVQYRIVHVVSHERPEDNRRVLQLRVLDYCRGWSGWNSVPEITMSKDEFDAERFPEMVLSD